MRNGRALDANVVRSGTILVEMMRECCPRRGWTERSPSHRPALITARPLAARATSRSAMNSLATMKEAIVYFMWPFIFLVDRFVVSLAFLDNLLREGFHFPKTFLDWATLLPECVVQGIRTENQFFNSMAKDRPNIGSLLFSWWNKKKSR